MLVRLKQHREREGLSQASLAELAGVSRQTLSSIEGGRQTPSVQLAMRLAEVLSCRVEDLFALESPSAVSAVLAEMPGPGGWRRGARMAVGRVGSRWVAHRLHAADPDPSDGVLSEAGSEMGVVDLFDSQRAAAGNVLVAGCAPLLGTLGLRLAESSSSARARWIRASSHRSLDLLDADHVHVAGIHLMDERSGLDNASVVRERFPGRDMCLVNLVSWQQGLVLAPGNPLGLGPRDIGRSGIRVAWREPGSGAHDLLLRLLGAERTDVEPGPGGSTWDGHMDVARAVAAGLADVGIAIEPAAAAFGLAFVPLAAERFDLVVPRETLEAPAIRRLLDAIDSRVFRADAASVGGYETSLTGHMTRLEPGSLLS